MKKVNAVFISLMIFVALGWTACQPGVSDKETKNDSLSGSLVVFHAGSLSIPVKAICDSFTQRHPGVKILTEAAGSKECARKITDLKKPCDVMLSADYAVIDRMLIPEFATWNIKFATNEMAIVYQPKSRYSDQINQNNWFDILMKKDVAYGRSNPDSDPCGVRAVLTSKLAEKYYRKPGLADRLLAKDQQYIRPKETDLLALLESGAVDYIFLYRSVALQHKLNYLVLPDEINLKKPELDSLYGTVSVQTLGKKPGDYVTETGATMVYGLTIPLNAPNPAAALAFVDFILSPDGKRILEENGQPSVVPAFSATWKEIPESLKKYALEH